MRNERRSRSRRVRSVIGGLVALVLLAASGVLVGVGVAGSPKKALATTTGTTPSSTSSTTTPTIPTTGKIAICHRTRSKKKPMVSITVSVRAWPAHLKHGDSVGACVTPPITTTTPTTTGTTPTGSTTTIAAAVASGPGKSGLHGNGHGKALGQGHGRGHGK